MINRSEFQKVLKGIHLVLSKSTKSTHVGGRILATIMKAYERRTLTRV